MRNLTKMIMPVVAALALTTIAAVPPSSEMEPVSQTSYVAVSDALEIPERHVSEPSRKTEPETPKPAVVQETAPVQQEVVPEPPVVIPEPVEPAVVEVLVQEVQVIEEVTEPQPQPLEVEQVAYVAPQPPVVVAPPTPVVQAMSAPASSGGLVGAALSQVGITQDCTAMVENALAAIGKPVGDLAPSQFLGLGQIVGSPSAGDLVVTGGHVAIYIGGGNVVSGGMNGVNATMVHPLSDLAGATFVRV